jgi:hypothetical protein
VPTETDGFAPELQLPWSLVDCSLASSNTAVVRVEAGDRQPRRDSVGRMGVDALADPECSVTYAEARFVFRNCLYMRMVEEFTDGFTEATGTEVGSSFRRLHGSELQARYREATQGIGSLLHYRLYFSDQVIDILCREAPVVTIRRFERSGAHDTAV